MKTYFEPWFGFWAIVFCFLSQTPGYGAAKSISFPTQSVQVQNQSVLETSETYHINTGKFLDTIVIGALDKVTARTSTITLKLGEPKKIGTLIVRALRAWKSNPEERKEAKVFFDVREQRPGDGTQTSDTDVKNLKRIFRGWLFQSHRGIASISHPVYDIWIINVKGEPHNGIFELEDTQPEVIDDETSTQIRELIDQLIKDKVDGEPIEIEPSKAGNISPQDVAPMTTEEALEKELEEGAEKRADVPKHDFELDTSGPKAPESTSDMGPIY